jgi:hypothetical protein
LAGRISKHSQRLVQYLFSLGRHYKTGAIENLDGRDGGD